MVRPVTRFDGNFACELAASEGPRPALLFEQAPSPLSFPLSRDLSTQFGAAVASLHQTADGLPEESALPRQALAEMASQETAQHQLRHARPFLLDAEYEYLLDVAARFFPRLSALSEQAPDYGLCHGDLVHSNLRISDERGITFFDFGGAFYGSRSYELCVCLAMVRAGNGEAWPGLWDAFLQDYASVRALPASLATLLPVFAIYRHLNGMDRTAGACPLRMGEEMITGFLPQAMASARKLEKEATTGPLMNA